MVSVEKMRVAGWVRDLAVVVQQALRRPFVSMVEEQAAVLASMSLPTTRCSAGSGSRLVVVVVEAALLPLSPSSPPLQLA